MAKTQEQMQAEMDELINEVIEKEGVNKVEESAAFKDLEAKLKEVQQMMDEQKAKSQPRQMMGCDDVVAALGVSRSTAYQVIRCLNQELEKDGYITVRGKISRAYFEKRTYGITASMS